MRNGIAMNKRRIRPRKIPTIVKRWRKSDARECPSLKSANFKRDFIDLQYRLTDFDKVHVRNVIKRNRSKRKSKRTFCFLILNERREKWVTRSFPHRVELNSSCTEKSSYSQWDSLMFLFHPESHNLLRHAPNPNCSGWVHGSSSLLSQFDTSVDPFFSFLRLSFVLHREILNNTNRIYVYNSHTLFEHNQRPIRGENDNVDNVLCYNPLPFRTAFWKHENESKTDENRFLTFSLQKIWALHIRMPRRSAF